ncbi:helix-turn-helix domain-containing protein [Paenibacillus flagellatus]|uniref:HTH araC/xylS-type domain-containing protein n=1 Tax=Paenibacillus flagellatus TaxID=2211139 RepID=A0A2V5KVY7_9BACL|nr:helix-turn-helix domain-containing protein [Paenibacillus flagellatus]PYI56377.1 hypothetical protein DLM86_05195 [Paenibacillus flagellatus]
MKKLLAFRLKTKSIFVKLLLGFMAVIALLLSFNVFSFGFFRHNIRDEIIRYNLANLTHTTTRYEEHLQLVHNVASGLFLNNKVRALDKPGVDYIEAQKVIAELQNTVSNPLLYLDNLFVYDTRNSFVFEKTIGADAAAMLNEHFHNERLTHDFWKGEIARTSGFTIYPATTFTETTYSIETGKTGLVLPFLVKSSLYPNFAIIGFIDANRIFRAYHQSINDNFFILNGNGEPLFVSNATGVKHVPELPPDRSYVVHDRSYYFYSKGAGSGFTYVNVVPDASISSQIVRLNMTLIALLAAAVVVSAGVSVLFAVRFHNPVKRIVESIRGMNASATVANHANELEMIRENIGLIERRNEAVHKDLEAKNNLLRYYGYMNKLKRIHSAFQPDDALSGEPDAGRGPYLFVLFQLSFKRRFYQVVGDVEEKATYFVREFVRQTMDGRLSGAQTFQAERDQILTLVPADRVDDRLREALGQIERVVGEDMEYCFLTIAVSSVHADSSEMTAAYEEALRLLRRRPFHDRTMILYGDAEAGAADAVVPPGMEQEFDVQLAEGNKTEAVQAMRRMVAYLAKRNGDAASFRRFADELTAKLAKTAAALLLAPPEPGGPGAEADTLLLYTPDELAEELEKRIASTCDRIRLKKEERDPIVGFALEYIDGHYDEDVSLDTVAGKLGITGGYLSTYFKDKTGTNFVDRLNDVRIRHAMRLLLETDLRIQEIAERVGYQNMNSFYRMFKKFSGVTPTDYRKRQKGEP